MSIATEITRLQNAKAALKTALEAKGATVASDAKLDDYATLVESISTGNSSPKVCTFYGLNIAPGPLYYGENGYEIKDDWNCNSYGRVFGKNIGSTYFNFIEMGELFEKVDFSANDGDIENSLDPLNGWRLPTQEEWSKMLTSNKNNRAGSTVNERANTHYACILLDGYLFGMLFFPDGEIITGVTLQSMNVATCNIISLDELKVYLNQGCIFIPAFGTSNGTTWNDCGNVGRIYSSTEASTDTTSRLGFTYTSNTVSLLSSNVTTGNKTNYSPVILVKSVL